MKICVRRKCVSQSRYSLKVLFLEIVSDNANQRFGGVAGDAPAVGVAAYAQSATLLGAFTDSGIDA